MSDDINDPEALADAMAEMDAWWNGLVANEQALSEAVRRRREIAHRANDPLDMFADSDGGNGDRFASRSVYRILCDVTNERSRKWYTVNDYGGWGLDTTGERTRMCRAIVQEMRDRHTQLELTGDPRADSFGRWIKATDSYQRYNTMSIVGCESHGMTVDAAAEFDQREDVIVAHDKLIELGTATATVRALTPQDMCSMSTAVDYDPDILLDPPVLIKEYFSTFIPDEHRVKMIFKVLGSALFGGNRQRLFVIVMGLSTTGKSQFTEAIEEALGDYASTGAASVFRGKLDDAPRPDILRVMRKRLVIFSEAGDAWQLHGDRVKDLTGGGNIAVRDMHSPVVVNRRPSFTPVVVTNKMPTIGGVDSGTKRRLLVIKFDRTLPPGSEDAAVKERFVHDPDVQRWLLARLVQGYIEASQEGLEDAQLAFALDTAKAFEALTHTGAFLNWLEETDQLGAIGSEQWETWGVKKTFVTMELLFDRYKYWVQHRGSRKDKFESLGYSDFNDDLRTNHGWESKKVSGAWRWMGRTLTMYAPTEISPTGEPFMTGEHGPAGPE